MATYVILYRFTAQGLKDVKRTVERGEEARKQNEARGFKFIGMYWTQGRYDLVTIVDAPSEEAAMASMLNIAALGNVSSESLRAFTAEEMQNMMAKA